MSDLPLAAALKQVDGLLDAALDATLKRGGLRRRHWAVLLALRSGPCSRAQIAEALLSFWVAAAVTQTDVVDDLVRRDWAATDGSTYTLTDAGEAALVRISADVEALRARALDGIDSAAVATTLAVLTRMSANLAAPEERSPL
jgi:DNA-binding MarR family transcriptional regulator